MEGPEKKFNRAIIEAKSLSFPGVDPDPMNKFEAARYPSLLVSPEPTS
jgi:hypothetical protein